MGEIIEIDKWNVDWRVKKVKLYVYFGNHTGKARIPREGAMFGCVILTN